MNKLGDWLAKICRRNTGCGWISKGPFREFGRKAEWPSISTLGIAPFLLDALMPFEMAIVEM
jgi:hypothetical protein